MKYSTLDGLISENVEYFLEILQIRRYVMRPTISKINCHWHNVEIFLFTFRDYIFDDPDRSECGTFYK